MIWLGHLVRETPELVLIIAFLVGLVVATEVGFRLGRRHAELTDSARSQVATVQAAQLGLFALLLGFTFAMAVGRFDERRQLVVKEANAIGTAVLRADLLTEPQRGEYRRLFRDYLEIRLASTARGADSTGRDFSAELRGVRDPIWRIASASAAAHPESITSGLVVESANAAFDAAGERDESIANRVPLTVLLLLAFYGFVVVAVVGYGNGLARERAHASSPILCALVAMVVLVIVDLDRPNRGLIRVDERSMTELRQMFDAPK